VERLQPEDVTAAAVNPAALGIKANDTMMRILWYGFNQAAIAKCVFFDLAPFRVNETMVQSGGQKGGWPWNKGNNKVAPKPPVNEILLTAGAIHVYNVPAGTIPF
jgi:hypothetical protein